mgnify:CR=1 FL=1
MCLHKYFQENCRYDSDCFRRLKYTHWATSHLNIMTSRPIQQKGPTFLDNCCLFSHFLPIFDLSKSQYQDLVNTCWLNNMTIFSVINSNGSVNSFYGLEISKPWRFWYFHCKYERIPSDRVSCIFKNFEWLMISESWYFTNKCILFKSRAILMMRFGNFIYPPDMKKVKAFWYLFN